MAGEGPQEHELRAQAEQIVPGGRVIFSPFCDRPWEALNALDVFVMPSRNEGMPLTLLEAMACSRCPVATTAGGIPEVLSRPDLGWLVPVGDADAFTAAMIDAASRTAEQRATMGEHAREHVQAHFNAATQFNALVDIIEPTGLTRWLSRARAPTHTGPVMTCSRCGLSPEILRRFDRETAFRENSPPAQPRGPARGNAQH